MEDFRPSPDPLLSPYQIPGYAPVGEYDVYHRFLNGVWYSLRFELSGKQYLTIIAEEFLLRQVVNHISPVSWE